MLSQNSPRGRIVLLAGDAAGLAGRRGKETEWERPAMKKIILLAGCVALALGATPRSHAENGPLEGGSNPRFSEGSTWCAVGDTEAVCRLKVVGVGRKLEAAITLDVLARRVFSCVSATGHVVRGYTERTYVGNTRQVFRSSKDGTVEEVLRGPVEWAMTRDAALECPTGYTLVPGSDVTETSWQLTAVGQKQAGLFNAAYTSM